MGEERHFSLDSTLSSSPDQTTPVLVRDQPRPSQALNFDLTPIFLDSDTDDPYRSELDTLDSAANSIHTRTICITNSREVTLSIQNSGLYVRRLTQHV